MLGQTWGGLVKFALELAEVSRVVERSSETLFVYQTTFLYF